MPKLEQEDLATQKSLRTLREYLKNNPGSVDDAF
jgi:hypothetical protein